MFVIDVYDRVSEEHARMMIGCSDVAEDMYLFFEDICDRMSGMVVDIYSADDVDLDRDTGEVHRAMELIASYHTRNKDV